MPHPWDNSAEVYSRSFGRLCSGTVDEILHRLEPREPHRLLLDIGTGPGTVAAAARAAGYATVGLDSDASMIALASHRHPEVAFARGAIERLPCSDQTFDAVTANFVINHAPDPRGAVRELFRALRPGGRLVATIWTSQPMSLNLIWDAVMRQSAVTSPPGTRLPPDLDFARTTAGLSRVLAEAGFEHIDAQETRWTFTISPQDLWLAVEAGIAGIGQNYRHQDTAGQERMRAAYDKITSAQSRGGSLSLPVIALIASADRPR